MNPLKPVLVDIANAVREKTGKTDLIKVSDLPEEIRGIESDDLILIMSEFYAQVTFTFELVDMFICEIENMDNIIKTFDIGNSYVKGVSNVRVLFFGLFKNFKNEFKNLLAMGPEKYFLVTRYKQSDQPDTTYGNHDDIYYLQDICYLQEVFDNLYAD